MKSDSPLYRIWTDVTGLLLPLVVIALYILDGPSALTMALTLLFLGAVFGTWVVTTDMTRWRAKQRARARRWRRRFGGSPR